MIVTGRPGGRPPDRGRPARTVRSECLAVAVPVADWRTDNAGEEGEEDDGEIVGEESDTGQLLRPEQPGRPDEQDEQHDGIRHHAAETATEETQTVLVARDQ